MEDERCEVSAQQWYLDQNTSGKIRRLSGVGVERLSSFSHVAPSTVFYVTKNYGYDENDAIRSMKN